MFLQDYDLEWNHTPGTAMGPADTLSRKDQVDMSEDNSSQILLPHLHINMLDAALAEKIAESTPFSLMMGYEPHAYLKIGQTFLPELEKCLHLLSEARKEAIAAHEKAALLMKDCINSRFTLWKVRDKVWLDNKNLKLHYQSKKFASKREGPFKIEQVLSSSTYKLRLPPTWKMHLVFHASLLSTYWETPKHGPNFLSPPPSVIRGEEEYTIETIIAHRGSTACQQFHV